MICDCIICARRRSGDWPHAMMSDEDHERLLAEDTTDCHAREPGALCGGCGECLRKQHAFWAGEVSP